MYITMLLSQPLTDAGSSHPVYPVEVAKDELLSILKTVVLSRIGMENEGMVN